MTPILLALLLIQLMQHCLTRLSILFMNMEKVAFRRWRSESHLLSSFSIVSFTCICRNPVWSASLCSFMLRTPDGRAYRCSIMHTSYTPIAAVCLTACQ